MTQAVLEKSTNMDELKARAALVKPGDNASSVGLVDGQSFALAQRVASVLAQSTLVPKAYQGNLPNCIIALNMAARIGADPMMVMQNLYVVHGNPSWSSQFLIASFNKSGRFSALRYAFTGKEGNDEWGCKAWAIEKETGERLEGALVTIGLAKKEGWYSKNGSKWQTMPQQMLMYRAASWFVRAFAPEIAMGLHTAEEIHDTYDLAAGEDGNYRITTEDLKAESVPLLEEKVATTADTAPNKPTKSASKQAAQPEPEEEPDDNAFPAGAMTVPCPNRDNKPVDELNCASCGNRKDCPTWA